MIDKTESFFKYFPISKAMQSWGLYVLSSGHSSIDVGHSYPPAVHPHGHDFDWSAGRVLESVTLVYIPRGKGVFESSASGVVDVDSGSLFVVFPGVWHRYKPYINIGWDEYWIEFAGEQTNHFIKNSRLKAQEPVIRINDESKIASMFMDVVDAAKYEPHGFEYLLSAGAFGLLAMLNAEMGIQKDEDIEKSEAIRETRRILMNDLEKQIDLKQLASQVGMSYSLFRKTFKEITGFTPHQYRLNLRLHKAGRLLVFTNLQIGNISDLLGFSSIYYFSELFKKKTGQSPLQYRKSGKHIIA